MYYCNYYRHQQPEETYNSSNEDIDSVDGFEQFNQFENFEIPPFCPYRCSHVPPFDPYRQPGPGTPPGPPPAKTPSKSSTQAGGPELKAVEPGAIGPCVYRYSYIWPKRGKSFWAWLTYVGRQSASGFKWNGHRWIYFGMDLRDIQSFQCY
jgi:hypothetical protein